MERAVAAFVEHYNHRRYHESLDNLTPAEVYFGRGDTILNTRRHIKLKTIDARRKLHFATAARTQQDEPDTPLVQWQSCPKNSEDGH